MDTIIVEHDINAKVSFGEGGKEYRVIGYQYIPPGVGYIVIDNERAQKIATGVELITSKGDRRIGFVTRNQKSCEDPKQ